MSAMKDKILVWDAPVRVFHWLLVLSFFGAFVSAESERWRLVHVSLGYTVGGLVAFRVLWGLVGTRYARFASFVRGPRAVGRYLGALLRGQAEHHLGHNPAGALAIVLLLLLSVVTVASGWALYDEIGGHWLEDLHEVVGKLMLLVVGVHVAGVLVSSWLERENLVRAMLSGKKPGGPGAGIRWNWWPLAVLLLAAVLGFWWLQWQAAPSAATASGRGVAEEAAEYGHGDDD